MTRDKYQQALQAAQTVADCQSLYEAELALKKQEYRQRYPESYQSVIAAHEVDCWIKAENRAQVLKSGHHSYGNLIQREQFI